MVVRDAPRGRARSVRAAQDVHDGDAVDEGAGLGWVVVDGVAAWRSVCRGVLADGGAGGGLVDDGLATCAGASSAVMAKRRSRIAYGGFGHPELLDMRPAPSEP